LNNKGQFSIIAALLVSVVLIATVVMTYSMIRNSPTQALPQVQSAIDETNLALKQILGFTMGYYGSVLQVTGNSSYAKVLAINYLQSGLVNVANMHPDWGASFNVSNEILSTNWFTNASYSRGSMSVAYNLTRLGLSGITYQASANLSVQVGRVASISQSELIVTADGKPVVNLGKQNFKFYRYSYSNSTFELISPSGEPMAFADGTYLLSIPSGVDPYSYAVQVVDQRGIMVTVWSFNHYVITLTWNSLYSTLRGETIVMELLQNGTIRWLGQNLQTTQTVPISPIPVKAIHINQTTLDGINREVPFQIEDWNNNYQVPAGLTENATVFSNRQMIVFLVNHNVSKVTIWWDGHDTAKQTPYAYINRYFQNDNVTSGTLTNRILSLDLNNWLTSTVGSSIAKSDFVRINGKTPIYGSKLAYIIHHGVVRDIIQQEAEWSSGISNCPNVYSQIVITLPANATYYTYQLRLMFVTSQQSRNITDICPIKITASISPLQTENGISSGFPIAQSGTGTFYNSSSIWQHHWSQFISGTTKGAGIMFTDYANKMLYAFDNSTSKTGALKVNGTAKTIELLPVTRPSVSFMSAKDLIWYGAVVTFDGTTPIYNNSTKSGLWITVEDPPQLTVITNNLVSITVTSSPSGSGYVKVDGNAITTPYTFRWSTGSNLSVQDMSPVNGTGTQYVWTSWSDGGAQTHTYTVPSQSTTVTANYKTQYQLSFAVSPSGGGATTPSGNIWVDAGVISISATPNPAYSFSTWTASGSISIANPSRANTTATIGGPGTLTATFSLTSTYITVTSSPSGSGYVKVDGNAITTPYTFLWTIGSNHTLQALSPVSGGTGIQYVYTGWSDGGAQTHTYTVPSQSTTVTANYKTQYYLTVNNGNHATSSGQGWYDAGASATFSISPTTVSGSTGIQYVFTNWAGTGAGSYSGSASSYSVTMNNPITETANWQTQYYLTVSSAYGTTSGQGWYNSSATAYAGLNSGTVSGGTGIQYVFTSWTSDASGTNYAQSNGIIMNAPKTATANWQTLYQVTFNYQVSGGGSGYSAPSVNYMLLGSQYSVTAGPAATVWADSGSTYTYISNPLTGSNTVQRWYALTGTSGIISSSTTINPTYYHQYYLTNNLITGSVNSITASPTGDSWYNNGSSVNVVLNYAWNVVASQSRSNLFSYTVDGSTTNVARSGTGTYSLPAISMTTYHTVSDNSKTQYYLTVTGGNSISYGTASPTGDNWYDSGSSTTVSSNGVYGRSGGSGTRVSSWKIDSGSNTNVATTGTVTTSSVSMTTYHTVTFNTVAQYQVTLDSGATSALNTITSPTVSGDNYWYDSGTSVTLTLKGVYGRSGGSGTRITGYKINGGSNNPETTTGTFTVLNALSISSAQSITTTTVTQYQVTLDSGATSALNSITSPTVSGDNYWYDSGTSVTLTLKGVYGRGGGTGTRVSGYKINGGSNNPESTTGTFTVLNALSITSAQSITTTTVTQYYLTVTGGNGITYGTPSTISGDTGWYDSGTSTTVSSNWVWNTIAGQSQTAITNYAIDGANQNPTRQESGTLTTSSITMSTYHTVAFASVTQYYVTVTSQQGTTTPSGSAWYDAGSTITISVSWTGNHRFNRWTATTGSITFGSSTSTSTTATINGYGTITATFYY
jgi:hypothetical protein